MPRIAPRERTASREPWWLVRCRSSLWTPCNGTCPEMGGWNHSELLYVDRQPIWVGPILWRMRWQDRTLQKKRVVSMYCFEHRSKARQPLSEKQQQNQPFRPLCTAPTFLHVQRTRACRCTNGTATCSPSIRYMDCSCGDSCRRCDSRKTWPSLRLFPLGRCMLSWDWCWRNLWADNVCFTKLIISSKRRATTNRWDAQVHVIRLDYNWHNSCLAKNWFIHKEIQVSSSHFLLLTWISIQKSNFTPG